MDLLDKPTAEHLLSEIERRLSERRLDFYKPYDKQKDFHRAGGDPEVRERLLKAGNQLGKTWAAGSETAMHLTGEYPDWWEGKRFEKAPSAWAASMTSQVTRDTVQRVLLGPPGEWGTGTIPKESIVDIKRATHGAADSVETIVVQHSGGGKSRITLKSYDQGRERFQGETLDFVWFDEEPPEDIYTEGLTRTNATNGIVWLTFTPLLGMSNVVKRFLTLKAAGTHVTNMTIYDAGHYTKAQADKIVASYPAHERDARAMGTPTLGSGRVFPIPDEDIAETAFPIPRHWPRVCGVDFGWDHPFAAVWIAWDRDTDCIHVYDAYRVREQTPMMHALAINQRGTWIPVAWPHDGLQHDKGSGEQLAVQYRNYGCNMMRERATFRDGSNSTEAGILEMLDRMQTGRFKVAKHLQDWFEEFRLFHRKEGKLVKEGDDLLSATRYAMMMLRKGVTPAKPKEQYIEAFQSFDSGMGMLG